MVSSVPSYASPSVQPPVVVKAIVYAPVAGSIWPTSEPLHAQMTLRVPSKASAPRVLSAPVTASSLTNEPSDGFTYERFLLFQHDRMRFVPSNAMPVQTPLIPPSGSCDTHASPVRTAMTVLTLSPVAACAG